METEEESRNLSFLFFFFSFSTRLNKNQGRNAISKGYIRSRVTLLHEFITLLTNGVLILLQRSRVRVASNVYRRRKKKKKKKLMMKKENIDSTFPEKDTRKG